MPTLLQDFRFGIRQLMKSPGFSLTAILTLSLGIGANTAVFSALNALLLKLLPIQDPNHIYTVLLMNGGTQPPNTIGTGHGNTSFSLPVYEALRTQSRVFADLIAHVPLGFGKVPVRYGNVSSAKIGEEVSGNYFSGLGVRLSVGSALSRWDEREHSARVIVSYPFWAEAFSRDPSVVGNTLYIKGIPFVIAGVTAPSFFGVDPGSAVDFWIPLQTRPELNAWGGAADHGTLYNSPKWWALPMIARLAPGVSPEQAEQALQPIFWQAASIGVGTLDPKRWPAHLGFTPIKGMASYSKSYREPIEIMMALVGLVLLIACTNVALLILARNGRRQREFAIRIATGARPSRLLRQLITESALLVAVGTSLGWSLAFAFTYALAAWAKLENGIAPDSTVLFFTLGTASFVAIVFSLVPFRRVFQISVEKTLRNTNQWMNSSRRRFAGGSAAIAFQIGMCFTLLVAAGLTLRTLLNYQNENLGMRAENLLVFDVNAQHLNGNVQAKAFCDRLLEATKSVPGVEASSLVQWRPGSGWLESGGILLDGTQLLNSSGTRAEIYSNSVGPDYFHTMGIDILQGRDIAVTDTSESPKVVIVNEDFARKFLTRGALGHHIENGFQVVGVVKNSKYRSVTESDLPTIYYPFAQTGITDQITVEIRTSQSPMALLPQMQRVLHNLDPDMALINPMKQATQFEKSYITPKLFARLALSFGVLAVVLVATGLYGTLVYRLERRRAEIGIRMALLALRGQVVKMILLESLGIAAVGLALGVPLSLAVSRLLRSQLYQLSGTDPISYGAAVLVTTAVAVLAALVPAHHASRIDPMEAIRTE